MEENLNDSTTSLLPNISFLVWALVPASVPRLVQQRLWYVLSCLWEGAYNRTHAANQKE